MIAQVELLIESPAGKVGLTVQDVMVAPESEGDKLADTPSVRVNVDGLYANPEGMPTFTGTLL